MRIAASASHAVAICILLARARIKDSKQGELLTSFAPQQVM